MTTKFDGGESFFAAIPMQIIHFRMPPATEWLETANRRWRTDGIRGTAAIVTRMQPGAFTWDVLDDFGILAAELPWDEFLAALRASGERFHVLHPLDARDWVAFVYERPAEGTWREKHLVGGEYEGRSFAISDTPTLCAADRITAIAAETGCLVLGYTMVLTVGHHELIAARGSQVLRYRVQSGGYGDYFEGDPLLHESEGFDAILGAYGFDANGWLARGRRWGLLWTALDPDAEPEEHRRLYFGPMRRRVDYIHRAALKEFEDEYGEDEES